MLPLLPCPVRARQLLADAHRILTDHEPSFVHGDLGPAHLLYDSGGLTAVIDWSDMAIADPTLDAAWIVNGLDRGLRGPAEDDTRLAGQPRQRCSSAGSPTMASSVARTQSTGWGMVGSALRDRTEPSRVHQKAVPTGFSHDSPILHDPDRFEATVQQTTSVVDNVDVPCKREAALGGI